MPLEDFILPFLSEDVVDFLVVGSDVFSTRGAEHRGRRKVVIAEELKVRRVTPFRVGDGLPEFLASFVCALSSMSKTKLHNNIQSFLKLSNVITVGETIGCCAEFFGEMLTE